MNFKEYNGNLRISSKPFDDEYVDQNIEIDRHNAS